MRFYEQYFEETLSDRPYRSNHEAIDDIRAFIDLCLNLIFDGRDPEGERLDMRGVVITPGEFAAALQDFSLQQRQGGNPAARREENRAEMVSASGYLNRRRIASAAAMPRVFVLVDDSKLSQLEEICFYLALVVEYDRKYERLFGYIQDNVAARLPTVGLGISLYQNLVDRQAEQACGVRLAPDSTLWRKVFKELPSESGESRLSRPMCLRDEVIAYLDGSRDHWQPDSEVAAGAIRVPLVYQWPDLVLEQPQVRLLHQICDRVHYRNQVMNTWGFEQKSPYGNGVSAVFYGSPGTGKTMAAQVIGRELNRPVYKVDLSQMVSKYIGETEKNMKRLFTDAKEQDLILFFDEADSLFAKRSDVSNSNDRYANMETGFLLQQFEEFDGITILATNYINNIDEAFRRRIKFYVKFPFPDADLRLELWKRMIPDQAVVDETLCLADYAARYELPGSDIKEVVTNAAYLAAAAGRGICNRDIVSALQIHYLKSGKKIDSGGDSSWE